MAICASDLTFLALLTVEIYMVSRPHSCSLEPQAAGLLSLRLASQLKLWPRITDGLWWLATAYEHEQEN